MITASLVTDHLLRGEWVGNKTVQTSRFMSTESNKYSN